MAANGNGRADDGKPDDGKGVETELRHIDLKKGHAGVVLRNYEAGFGVEVEDVDPADLFFKAGLRAGDVIHAFNGEPIDGHEAALKTIQELADGDDGNLAIEYRTAAEAERAAAASLPPQKSLGLAYLLWLVAPPLDERKLRLDRKPLRVFVTC